MRVKLAKWGNSVGLRLPKALIDSVGWAPGAEVEVTADGHGLRVSPPAPRYRLEDLLAQIEPGTTPPPLEDWGPDVGAEIIDDEFSCGQITLDDLLKRDDASGRR